MKHTVTTVLLMTVFLVVLAGCVSNSVVQVNTPVPAAQGGTPASEVEVEVPGVSIRFYAPGPNPLVNTPDANGRPAGFWLGLWHGIIAVVTLVVSFVSKQNMQMYEVHNDGNLYNLGFFLGVVIFPGIFSLLLGSRR